MVRYRAVKMKVRMTELKGCVAQSHSAHDRNLPRRNGLHLQVEPYGQGCVAGILGHGHTVAVHRSDAADNVCTGG